MVAEALLAMGTAQSQTVLLMIRLRKRNDRKGKAKRRISKASNQPKLNNNNQHKERSEDLVIIPYTRLHSPKEPNQVYILVR